MNDTEIRDRIAVNLQTRDYNGLCTLLYHTGCDKQRDVINKVMTK